MTGLLVDLIKTDFLGFRRRREKGDRAGHERKPQKPFQLARGATHSNSTIHERAQYLGSPVDVESISRSQDRYLQWTA